MKLAVEYPYLCKDRDRHGNIRYYFRRGGFPKVRIRERPGSQEFFNRYHELMRVGQQSALPTADESVKPGTYRWLCCEYLASKTYARLEPCTQRTRRLILDATYGEPLFPGSSKTFADFPLSRITSKSLRVLRDRKGTPEGSNNRVKAIRAVFKWALNDERITTNPARDLEKVSAPSDGYHSWTIEEVEQYEARHPIGSKARLALALIMYTGVRRSDVVRLGKQHVRNGWFHFKQHKNRNRHPITIEIPILPELQAVVEASPIGDLTYLVTDFGRPFAIAGFGNKMRQWCNEAGLVHCSAHGLRKAGAAIAAENGATEHQLMAIFGWETIKEAERYTKAARRRKMAGDAMGLMRSKRGT